MSIRFDSQFSFPDRLPNQDGFRLREDPVIDDRDEQDISDDHYAANHEDVNEEDQ